MPITHVLITYLMGAPLCCAVLCCGGCTEPAAGGSGSTGSAGGVGSAARDAEAGLADKTERWGSIKKIAAAADGTLWLSYKRGLLEKYSEAGQLLWNSSSGSLRQDRSPAAAGGSGGGGSSSLFKPAGEVFTCHAACSVKCTAFMQQGNQQ